MLSFICYIELDDYRANLFWSIFLVATISNKSLPAVLELIYWRFGFSVKSTFSWAELTGDAEGSLFRFRNVITEEVFSIEFSMVGLNPPYSVLSLIFYAGRSKLPS